MEKRGLFDGNRPVNRHWIIGLFIVAVFGILQGHFAWKLLIQPFPRSYLLSFDPAHWIEPDADIPQSYFRKKLYIPMGVTEAWIQVAASDSYLLFVNDRKVAEKTFVSQNVSGLHDLTRQIKAGENVIALVVRRKSYPGSARLAVLGGYRDRNGQGYEFVSDATWKTAYYEERNGEFSWYSTGFNDSEWSNARIIAAVHPDEPLPVSYHPTLMTLPPQGKWIWHSDPAARSVYFQKEVFSRGRATDAWIRIAAGQSYKLFINGMSVGGRDEFHSTYDLYNVTPRLQAGHNTIGISVVGERASHALLADGFIEDDTFPGVHFQTDSTWKAISDITPDEYILPSSELPQWEPAVVLTEYPSDPWGLLVKEQRQLSLDPPYTVVLFFWMTLTLSIGALLFIGLWAAWSGVYYRLTGKPWMDSFVRDAILHLPPLVLLLIIYLLQFDTRFGEAYSYRPIFIGWSIALLFVLRIGLLAEGWLWQKKDVQNPDEKGQRLGGKTVRRAVGWGLVLLLLTIGFLMRFANLDDQSLSHDETETVAYAQGFLERGYPSRIVGTRVKPIATYEILPYPIALSIASLGRSDLSVRLPAVVFGTITIGFIYYIGKKLFNQKVGFLAALIYAFCPWSIYWARNVFYPQQAQLAALATTYLFYRAVEGEVIKPKYLYPATGCFALTYLSWEGSGFLLPALLTTLPALKKNNWGWLKDRHLWSAMGMIGLAVLLQQARRKLIQNPYLIVGMGKSDIGMPTLFFLDPMYDPFFYIENFFLFENHVILSIIMMLGIPLLGKDRGLRYFYLLLIGVFFIMTNFLSATATRYGYYVQPYLMITASAVLCRYIELLADWIQKTSTLLVSLCWRGVALAFPILLFLTSNDRVLKLYELSSNPTRPSAEARRGVYNIDYRTTNQYVMRHWKKGDAIIVSMPHVLQYYTDHKGDYALNTNLARQSVYDVSESYPGLLDKYVGNPVLRSLSELIDVMNKRERVWMISVPESGLAATNEEEVVDYINRQFRVVYESYQAKVYLWER